ILNDRCEIMRDGSRCALGGLTPMPVTSALDHFPEDFAPAARRTGS
ncbi:MAG: NADH-ubiquinone oxidoreductase-F iron-sulfur binding region domain-containing protein, partial [Alphaproteobacteria bacterium]